MNENSKLLANLEIGDFVPTNIVLFEEQEWIAKVVTLNKSAQVENCFQLLTEECNSWKALKHSGIQDNCKYFVDGFSINLLFRRPQGKSLLETIINQETKVIKHPTERRLLDIERAGRWCLQLGKLILFLHNQQPFPILHRNLNPMTVWIGPDNETVHVIDYGLLNSFRIASSHISDGHLLLTRGMFNAEDLFGYGWSSHLSDIFSFGRLMDFMFSGSIPDSINLWPQFDRISTPINQVMQKKLVSIIVRCCDPESSKRYQNIEEVLSDLNGVLFEGELEGMKGVHCTCGFLSMQSDRFCQRCGRLLHIEVSEIKRTLAGNINYDDNAEAQIAERLRQTAFSPLSRFKIREQLDQVQSTPGFDELISLNDLPQVVKMPHQRETALTALHKMRGRALLADEVGLGKTVEAGLILKELIRRGLATRILILCPNQLRSQWQAELYEKFEEIFLILGYDIETPLAWYNHRLIAPYNAVRNPFHVDALLRQSYDLVILDEAHCLNYPENEQILRVMKNIQKKFFLLLSATPMHDSLDELYTIITLLRPGHFPDIDSFRNEFIDKESGRPLNLPRLHRSMREVMIRHSREQVKKDYQFPERTATTLQLSLNKKAEIFYNEFRQFLQDKLSDITNPELIQKMDKVVERLCSSKRAFNGIVNQIKRDRTIGRKFGQDFLDDLQDFATRYPETIIQPKVDVLVNQVLRKMTTEGERVLVFSQFQETASYLYTTICNRYTDLSSSCILYDSESRPAEKDQVLNNFRYSTNGILFCPGEASEGLNLQFCSVMVNFDLPWDPMQLEQRIGRIQRIGGKQKILIFNLILNGTIEEVIIDILKKKLKFLRQQWDRLKQY